MKLFKTYFLLVAISSLLSYSSKSQTVQGAVVNTLPQEYTIVGKTSVGLTNVLFRNIYVVLSIPDQGINNPVATITTNYIPNLNWSQNTTSPEVGSDGRAYYTFSGFDNAALTTVTWGTNNSPILKVTFSNNNGLGSLQINDLTASSIGEGGPSGNSYWYVEIIRAGGGDITNYASKFYGAGALNNAASPSFAPAQSAAFLPLLFQDFNVIKQGNTNALLTWTTSQEQDVSHFILERSYSQLAGWTAIGQVKAKGNTNAPTSYTFTDLNVYDGRAASKVVFYRVRAIDLNAAEKIFPIRSIKFSAYGGKEISLYPNPANDGFVISIPIVNPGNNKIRMNMVNRLGQVVHAREISAANATNYFYDLKTPGIISGEYMLQIIYDGELLDTKKVIVQH